MASKTFYFCDLCGRQTTQAGSKCFGIKFELGYSEGGWGNRKNFAAFSGGHCCNECFERYKKASKDFADVVFIKKVQK